MKEVWDLAISGQVLPFTLLLVPIALYWLLALLGTLDLEFLHVDVDADTDLDLDTDFDADADLDAAGHASADTGHGPLLSAFHGLLRVVNANDVPLMIVVSVFFTMSWMCAMLGNLWFNAAGDNLRGTVIGVSGLVAAVGLTRLVTEPLKPVFRAIKGKGSENRPVVGRSGTVRTRELTDKHGQVEIQEGGEVLLLNARLAEGTPALERGAEVIVYDYDKDTGIYYVRSLSNS